VFINERRNVVADVEDEPDGDKSGDAVQVNLHEVSNDVPIQKSHWGVNNPVLISVPNSVGSANRNRRNMLKIPNAKARTKANLQMTKDSSNDCSPFGFSASFVICSRHR
jgi:hypothetical protein